VRLTRTVALMRAPFPALVVTLGLLAAGLTGLAIAPAASAFEPTLTYVDCPDEVKPANTKCAELTVPLDWQTPDDGRTTRIALRVIPSARGGGGFTFNPGGPSGSGIEIGEYVYSDLPRQVRDRFDFVMWDPRGVALSGPKLAGCSPKPEADLPLTGPVAWEKVWSEYAVATGAALSDCFAKNPDSAPYLGTWQVVRDMEAMRIALGYPRWNFWGMSYGTRIAYTYAKTFPDSLRTVIVDGSLWPQESVYRLSSQQPMAYQTALQVYSSVMGRAQTRKFEQILEVLDDTYIETAEGSITRWSFSGSVFGALGSQAAYSGIRDGINALYDALVGQPSTQTRRAAVRAVEALDDLQPDPSESYLFSFINCADLHDRPTPEMAGRVASSAARDYGTTFALATDNIVSCQGLPADYSPPVPSDWTTIELATPPVVVLSLGDRATPWLWGKIMANQYAGSRIINYNSSQHVTYMSTPSTCVNDPVTRYLLRRQLPPNNVFCSFVPSLPPPQA
jgi:pimeloyl-ACP methyl ester carboxylesterase